MNFKKTLVSSILCAATVMGVSESANATAYATAVLDLSNVTLFKSDGTTAVALGDFTSITANNSGAATASLNGTPSTTSDTQNIFGSAGGAINLTNQWVGVNAVGDDNYSQIAPPPTATYSNADADLAGSIIDLGSGAGATAQTRADTSLDTAGATGNSQSNLELSSSSIFTVASTLASGFIISFDYLAYVATELTADEVNPGSVGASTNWSARLRKSGGTGAAYDQTFTNADLNLISSWDAPFIGTEILSKSGHLNFATGALDTLNTYTLTIDHKDATYATTSQVPEPSSLILLGFGLVGLAWSARRKIVDSLAA